MDIEGTYTIQATAEDVWLSLLDQHLLQETIPGLEQLKRLDEPKYTVTLQIKQPPLLGTYHGHVTVTAQDFPTSYALAFVCEGRQSTVNGNILLTLREQSGNTVVAYTCTLNLGKLSTLLPTQLVKGNIKHLFQQFFTDFAAHLRFRISTASNVVEASHHSSLAMPQQEDDSEAFSPSSEPDQPTFLLTLVQLLKLGAGDPQLEARWVKRMRRFSTLSGLIFLVWVGTRLPRRQRS